MPRVVLSQNSLGLALILVTDQGLLPVSGTELTVSVHASSTIHKGLFTEHFDMMSLSNQGKFFFLNCSGYAGNAIKINNGKYFWQPDDISYNIHSAREFAHPATRQKASDPPSINLHIGWYHFIAALVGRYRTITLHLGETTPNPIVTERVKAIISCSVLLSPVKYKITTSKRPQARLPARSHYYFFVPV